MPLLSQLSDAGFITKAPKLKSSQDYTLLKKEGLAHIEKLAHRLWTDYNTHDPGITILELLCYAITDLGYRTGYPIKDILTEDDRGVPVNHSNFHQALEVFTCNPVSFDDLRKLLIDITGVRNAWVQKHKSVIYGIHEMGQELVNLPSSLPGVKENPPLNGLYDIFIEYDDFVQDNVPGGMNHTSIRGESIVTRDDVRRAVKKKVNTHRNLCEDLMNICDLEKEKIAVCADIEISPGTHVEELLAEIFYRLEQHISPIIRFHTIEDLLDKGKTTDQIFEGPILEHGFIDKDEFRAVKLKCEIRTSDVIRILMDMESEGVAAIKNISLLSFIDDRLRTQEKWLLELDSDGFKAPAFSPDRSKIVFYRNEIPYYANRDKVNKLLKEKKARDIEAKLKGHEKNLPIPVGTCRQLESYYPFQNELPATYRVGTIRVTESETLLRKAQARQLKAYLMFFEQLLANYLSQLAHVRELFSWKSGANRTYFTQQISGIADIENMYIDHDQLPAKLDELIEDAATRDERKNRFLDHLLARFCEHFTDYSLLMYGISKEETRLRLIDDKRTMLADYPLVSSRRGVAYDYRYPHNPDNISGFQRRLYRMLGIRDIRWRHLAGRRFSVLKVDKDGTTKWRFVLKAHQGQSFLKVFYVSLKALSRCCWILHWELEETGRIISRGQVKAGMNW